jgi:hypothetical protein
VLVQGRGIFNVFLEYLDILRYPNKAIGIDDKDPIVNKDILQQMPMDYDFEDQYAYAYEDMDE